MKNPNAGVAVGSTFPALFVVWLAGHFGIDLSAEAGVVCGGALVAAVLFIGRRGLVGVVRIVWRGNPPQA